MNAVDVVAMLIVAQYLFFGGLVAKSRRRFNVPAPAVAGNEQFERIYRVHMNTLEMMVALLPALYAAARYLPNWIVVAAGTVFMVGRFIYWRDYVAAPSKRRLGFVLSIVPVCALVLATLVAATTSGSGA